MLGPPLSRTWSSGERAARWAVSRCQLRATELGQLPQHEWMDDRSGAQFELRGAGALLQRQAKAIRHVRRLKAASCDKAQRGPGAVAHDGGLRRLPVEAQGDGAARWPCQR